MWSVVTALALLVVASASLESFVQAEDLPRLTEAFPLRADISAIYPVFDFDGDSCYPSAAISRTGKQNAGLKPSGRTTGRCRNDKFLELSNTYHRYACVTTDSTKYCGHSFALYVLKDQRLSIIGGGHRHGFEYVILWTKNGATLSVTYSASTFKTVDVTSLSVQSDHLKFVYHKKFMTWHSLRPARSNEKAENPHGVFVMPAIASWYTMKGDNVSNTQLRELFNGYDYGEGAHFHHVDGSFIPTLNLHRPRHFPYFPFDSGDSSK